MSLPGSAADPRPIALNPPPAPQAEEEKAVYVPEDRLPGRRKRSLLASVGLHTFLILATFLAVFPVVWVFLASLKPKQYIASLNPIDHPTFDNYVTLITQTQFMTWFGNSVVVAAFTMLFGIAMSATAGFALARYNFPGKRPLMWVFLITQMFPVAILIVPIYAIMSTLHLINTPIALVIAYCATAVPFCTWMLKGYFDTIPKELDEAAMLDGLGPFGTFWRVILPLARPGLAVTAFYTFLTAWGEVAYASAFLNTTDKFTLAYGLQTFIPAPPTLPLWELLTPAAVLITIPAAIVFFFAQKHLVAGLTAGGTKG